MGLLALTTQAEHMLRGLFEHGSLLLPDSWDFEDDCDRLIWLRDTGTVIVDVGPPIVDVGPPIVDVGPPIVDVGPPIVDDVSQLRPDAHTDSFVEPALDDASRFGQADGRLRRPFPKLDSPPRRDVA